MSSTLSKQAIAVLFAAIVLLAVGLLFSTDPEPEAVPQPVAVKVYRVNNDAGAEILQFSGTTKSAERAVLRFQVSGRVAEKMVRLGDKVTADEVLYRLSNPEIEPLARQARQSAERASANLTQAQRDFSRLDALFAEQAVTRQEWESASTGLKTARAARAAAAAELERAEGLAEELTLKAPFAGVVTELLLDQGEVVQAGSAAARLANPQSVELELAVSDTVLAQLVTGQAVTVQSSLDKGAAPVIGAIVDISPFRERGSLPQVIVALPAAQLNPGVPVTAELEISSAKGTLLPMSAVLMSGENRASVYTIGNNEAGETIATLRPVRPLRIGVNGVLVEAELAIGQQVVTAGLGQLYQGATVKVVQ